ncbi:hypothetical protein [Herbiconiux sp. L3-i23]|uniref:hypothetical protein n=1 Tax=Herbiconiux sp. L3-i23 TaxID=2905871 RepID=UPI00204951A5|nr:hypothetical protein [Herbiconiux sp. L3-i23]BDI24117.1 hypothetical protein L3i23_28930 [Herbiconiux sp. L3-i23]
MTTPVKTDAAHGPATPQHPTSASAADVHASPPAGRASGANPRSVRPRWLLPVAIAATLVAGIGIGAIAGGAIGFALGGSGVGSSQTGFGPGGGQMPDGGFPGAPGGQTDGQADTDAS